MWMIDQWTVRCHRDYVSHCSDTRISGRFVAVIRLSDSPIATVLQTTLPYLQSASQSQFRRSELPAPPSCRCSYRMKASIIEETLGQKCRAKEETLGQKCRVKARFLLPINKLDYPPLFRV